MLRNDHEQFYIRYFNEIYLNIFLFYIDNNETETKFLTFETLSKLILFQLLPFCSGTRFLHFSLELVESVLPLFG